MKISYNTAKRQLQDVQEAIYNASKMEWSRVQVSELMHLFAKLAELVNNCYESKITSSKRGDYINWLVEETFEQLCDVSFHSGLSFHLHSGMCVKYQICKSLHTVSYFMIQDMDDCIKDFVDEVVEGTRVSDEEAGRLLCSLDMQTT